MNLIVGKPFVEQGLDESGQFQTRGHVAWCDNVAVPIATDGDVCGT